MNRVLLGKFAGHLCLLMAIGLIAFQLPRSAYFPRAAYGPILQETHSDYSHIRVRGKGTRRSLLFVTESGRETLQTSVDLDRPGILQVPYTHAQFASFLIQPNQSDILIIGVGGGSMLHFIDRHFPESRITGLEIDPVVVDLSRNHFHLNDSPTLRIFTVDAFKYVATNRSRFDAIYMDAFLKPSVDRVQDGLTARLKTIQFLRQIKAQLNADGVLSCNLIKNRDSTRDDIDAIEAVFPTVKLIPVPNSGNLVVIACAGKMALNRHELVTRARKLDRKNIPDFSFETWAQKMR